jgi:hypothetical protein
VFFRLMQCIVVGFFPKSDPQIKTNKRLIDNIVMGLVYVGDCDWWEW